MPLGQQAPADVGAWSVGFGGFAVKSVKARVVRTLGCRVEGFEAVGSSVCWGLGARVQFLAQRFRCARNGPLISWQALTKP